MAQYIQSPRDWVREQVEVYERTNGSEGNTLRDTGLLVIIMTHTGNRQLSLVRPADPADPRGLAVTALTSQLTGV